MRKDFNKVLCEEPRHKGWGSHKSLNKQKGSKRELQKATQGNYDEWTLPEKQSMFGRRGRGTKHFGEHLGPLVNFLRSKVGCHWDDTYSEIRKVCPNDSAVTAHIYQHLWGYVRRYVHYKNGKPYGQRSWGGPSDNPIEDRGRDNTFYVDINGILRRAPRIKKVKTQREKTRIWKKDKLFALVNDIWYEVLFKTLPKPEKVPFLSQDGKIIRYDIKYPYVRDVLLEKLGKKLSLMRYRWRNGKAPPSEHERFYKNRNVYCYKLRQLNSKEIKRLKLRK